MLTQPNMPENPALQPDGTLKHASELTWFHSPSNALPIGVGFPIVCELLSPHMEHAHYTN